MKYIFIIAFSCIFAAVPAQQIIIDGKTNEWSDSDQKYSEPGDHQGLDVEFIQVSYNDVYLFIRMKLNQEILIQQNNDILLGIDFDNNSASGFNLGNIGAELVFNLGQRNGILNPGSGVLLVQHDDIGLITSPTVSSDEFEIAVERSFVSSGFSFEMLDEVSIHISAEEEHGDQVPDSGKFEVSIDEPRPLQNPDYSLIEYPGTDFRFMSYNVLRDNIFQFGIRNSFRSLMRAVDADVYCFQEVYDHSDQELLDLMFDLELLDNNETWYSVKHVPDLVTISRFPIVYEQNVGGNGIAVLEVENEELLIVNMHLPCCENDFGREIEIDQVLQFIRRSKEGQSQYFLKDNTPYIFCGDLNLVGRASQLESLLNGNILDNNFFGPDVTLDWDDDDMQDLLPPTTGFPSVFTWYSPESSFSPGRLDFIIYTDSRLEALNSYVLNAQGLNQAEQAMFQINDNSSLITSDHMPVVADFKFKTVDSSNDLADLDIEIYPNPARSVIRIKNTSEVIELIEIYDLAGRLIRSVKYPQSLITLDLQPSVYIFSIHAKSGKRAVVPITIH